jgi:hypothetical protein
MAEKSQPGSCTPMPKQPHQNDFQTQQPKGEQSSKGEVKVDTSVQFTDFASI